jgi:hypothetical protein
MREFSKVSPMVWRNRVFASLPSADAKLAYFYFLTCEHQNSGGSYRVLDGYAAADLGCPVSEWAAARREVEAAGLIIYDEHFSEVYIRDWFRENPITNNKHALGTERLISNLDSDKVREAAEADFSQSCEELEQRIAKREAERRDGTAQGSRLANTSFLTKVKG